MAKTMFHTVYVNPNLKTDDVATWYQHCTKEQYAGFIGNLFGPTVTHNIVDVAVQHELDGSTTIIYHTPWPQDPEFKSTEASLPTRCKLFTETAANDVGRIVGEVMDAIVNGYGSDAVDSNVAAVRDRLVADGYDEQAVQILVESIGDLVDYESRYL